MGFTVTGDANNDQFEFASEAAFEAANDWYSSLPKSEIVAFCAARGVTLVEQTDDPYYKSGQKLRDNWAFVAMQLWAAENASA